MAKWNSQTVSNDIADFSDDPKLRKARRRRRIRKAVLILAILVGLFFGAKYGYRAYRSWRVDQNLVEAEAAARVKDWSLARAKARSVLIARNGDFRAFRVWTEALGHLNEPGTYMAAAMLFQNPQSTKEDRLMALRTMVKQAPDAVTLASFMSLTPDVRSSLNFQVAISPIMTRRGGADLVIKTLTEMPEYSRSASARLEVIRALVSRPERERVEQAADLLMELVEEGATEEALEAMVLLGEAPNGLDQRSMIPRLADWVSKAPGAETIHYLLSWHPELAAAVGQDGRRAKVFRRAIERFGGLDPGVVGTWLVRHGQAELALEFLEEPAQTRADAYISWLHALLRAEKSEELKAALKAPPSTADLVDVYLVRAAMARRDGNGSAEKAAWTEAMNQAVFDLGSNRFIEIARYASSLGASQASADAWVAAIRSGWGALPMYGDLVPEFGLLASQGRSEDLLAVFRSLLRLEPWNKELQANYYYLGLLHESVEPPMAIGALISLLDEDPERAAARSSLVFGLLMEGKGAEALGELAKIETNKGVSPMMMKALEGAAKVVSGEVDAGRLVLSGVSWDLFMPQERRAVLRILRKWDAEELPLPELAQEDVVALPKEIPAWRKALEDREAELDESELPRLELPKMPKIIDIENIR